MKTLIGIPCMDNVPYQFTESLIRMEGKTNVLMKANSLIYDSRNLISLAAIEQDFDNVLWLDSDMVFHPQTLKILRLDLLDLDAEIVTGLYFKRNGENLPVLYSELEEPCADENGRPVKRIRDFTDYPQNDTFTVRGCGFGCVITSVKLLREVWDRFGPAFNPYPWAGEDISFCHRVNLLGYPIWCDSRVSCGHVGTHIFTEDEYLRKRGGTH